MTSSLQKTRFSLGYVVAYLTVGGMLFLFLPDTALTIFQSNGSYDDVMIRATGLMLLGLDIIVIQIIRLDLIRQLYPSTVGLRIFLTAGLLGLYLYCRDPMFLIIAGIVLLGVLLSVYFYLRERS